MTEAQRVGQLFMVGVPNSGPVTSVEELVSRYAVGGVVLYAGTNAGLSAVRGLTEQLQGLAVPATNGVRLYVATDQEGGQIQELRGVGFDTIPSGLPQGQEPLASLEQSAHSWGNELSSAGVNVDLAPVVDVVPPSIGTLNQPLGRYDRELGYDPTTVSSHGAAVIHGLQAAGVAATMKHFPGLGRVNGNTDVSTGVTDTTTTQHDPYLAPFTAGVDAGARFAMVSLATYTDIDPSREAVFSSTVIQNMLRSDIGFRGLVISDDLGFAAQVQAVPPGQRAVDFLVAGGDMVLATRPPSTIASMINGVTARTEHDPTFHQLVDEDALTVLQAKQTAGLLPCL